MGSSLSLCVRKKETKEMILPEVTEGLLIEILMRLPAKSLMRFKCVSKLLLSLISSRYFTNLFLEASSSRQRLFAYLVGEEPSKYACLTSSAGDNSDKSVSVIDQDLTLPGLGDYFVNSVRGLSCFAIENRVQICNFNTRQVVELPPVVSFQAKWSYLYTGWNYLGHDPVHDEYKVLRVVSDLTKKSSEHQLLVLGAGASWRKIQCNIHIPHCHFRRGMAISINGVLYYGVSSCFEASILSYSSNSSYVLMSFDWSSEEFKLIEYPNIVRTGKYSTCVMNYNGKLAVFGLLKPMGDGIGDVWVLEDAEKSQWSNKKTFVLPLSQMNVVRRDVVIMGGTSHSGKVWLAQLVDTPDHEPAPLHFFIYDFERNEITQRIEIRPTPDRIELMLGAIGGSQLFGSFKTKWSRSAFWEDSESIVNLEI